MKTNDNRRGFTLLEVIIAAAVVAIGISGLAAMFVTTATLERTLDENALATFAAAQKMEEILNEDPADIPDFNGDTFSVPESGEPFANMLLQADGTAPGLVEIGAPVLIGDQTARVITVTIRWRNLNVPNTNRQIFMNTLFFFEE